MTNKDDENNVEDPGSQHFPPENNNTPRIQHSSPHHNNQSTHLNSRRGSNHQQHEFNYEDLKHSEKSWQKTENNLKVHFLLVNKQRLFPRQSLKRFTFRVKLSDSIFFLLGLSPIIKLI